MKKATWIILILVLAFSLTLSACTRSASTPPATTATTGGDLPFPVPATQNQMEVIMTQTAIAKTGPTQAPIIIPTATPGEVALPTDTQPVPAEPTATPEPVQPAAPVATFAPTEGRPSSYTIQEGEFPFCIARRFNIQPGALLSANNLTLDSKPAAGTTLTIPSGVAAWDSGSRALIAHPTSYTVQSGDSIYSIACDYGDVDPNGIISVNGLASPYTLTAGQTIQIP
jgi:LysM repeat protein